MNFEIKNPLDDFGVLLRPIKMILLVLAIPVIGTADVLVAYWDFGPDAAGYTEEVLLENVNGTPTLSGMSIGEGYDVNGQSGESAIDVAGGVHQAGQSLAWGSGVNDGNQEWVLGIDLTGYQDLGIRWDYRSTATGPSSADLDYKVGEGSWVLLESITLSTNSTFHTYQKDLSAILAINNQPSVQFRLSNFSGGSGSGTHRIDNVQVSAIPEPVVIGFIAFSGVGFIIVRRIFM